MNPKIFTQILIFFLQHNKFTYETIIPIPYPEFSNNLLSMHPENVLIIMRFHNLKL